MKDLKDITLEDLEEMKEKGQQKSWFGITNKAEEVCLALIKERIKVIASVDKKGRQEKKRREESSELIQVEKKDVFKRKEDRKMEP